MPVFKRLSFFRPVFFLALIFSAQVANAQPNVDRIDPPNWFVGLPEEPLQLMVHGTGIGGAEVSVDYPGVELTGTETTDNPNYLFVNLKVTRQAKFGTMKLTFKKDGKKQKVDYELKPRQINRNNAAGLDQDDLVYLIMPDRFSNGNPDNDVVKGSVETALERDSMFYRHGGDLKGITNHLDYIQELGVTAIWLNPVLINDRDKESYHGYAATDFYETDPRICSVDEYAQFVSFCHSKKIKVVMDVVYNHIADYHHWMKDLPEKDWINQWGEYTQTSYRATTLIDPHASEADRKKMADGWFNEHMPDVNQRNPRVATYFIQNTIWWMETSGVDALRIDTYAYPDQKFMSQWGRVIKKLYPRLSIFGETWVHGGAIQSWFTEDNNLNSAFSSNLPGVTDFQLYYAFNEAMGREVGWTDGVNRIYYTLVKDYLYNDPTQNVVFLDNHDLSRFYSVAGEDFGKYKMGIGLLMTMRGTPQLYYGTEILMKNFADPDGKVRDDFPGGWPGDPVNKFKAEGRDSLEQAAFTYVQKLAKWRKGHPAIKEGKLMQFVPESKVGVYTYFRYTDDAAVMVVVNGQNTEKTINTDRYAERTEGYGKLRNVITEKEMGFGDLTIPAKSTLIFDLVR